MVEADRRMFREPKPGYHEVIELVHSLNPSYPPISVIESALSKLYEDHKAAYREEIESQDLDYDEEKRNDPWKGLFNYKHAEYRDVEGRYVPEAMAQKSKASIWIYRESDWTIMSSETKQSASIRDPKDKNFRFYRPTHPVTGQPCSPSQRGWKGTQFIDPEHPERNSFESLQKDHRIAFGPDHNKVPQQKRFIHEVDTNVCKSVFVDYADGEKELVNLFNRAGLFLAPKHSQFVSRFVEQAVYESGIVLDCFGGSGSTSDAVLRINRAEKWRLKYLTAEMGAHFETLIVNRLKKVVYASEWRKGTPQSRDTGISHAFKIVRLESYEDTLNNLNLRRSPEQDATLAAADESNRDAYLLGYFLDVESAGSASLLDVEQFRDPFAYKLHIATSSAGETKETTVDLVETFNWLLGLKVKHIDTAKGFLTVTGEKRAGGRCLILWRTLSDDPKADNEALEKFLTKLAVNPADTEYDFLYVNGAHTLNDPHNKVHLIEETFQRLMFDTTTFESLS
jgi:adenine-specific DNA-methyltransferase